IGAACASLEDGTALAALPSVCDESFIDGSSVVFADSTKKPKWHNGLFRNWQQSWSLLARTRDRSLVEICLSNVKAKVVGAGSGGPVFQY
ncbi:hypothetical protein, partial [Noviherbaspirillum galbum]|uniref:hypothetical protein n=1 Tax=Noviherbaspirillum galbum TaxID=2709383 RepID=UPI001969FB34